MIEDGSDPRIKWWFFQPDGSPVSGSQIVSSFIHLECDFFVDDFVGENNPVCPRVGKNESCQDEEDKQNLFSALHGIDYTWVLPDSRGR